MTYKFILEYVFIRTSIILLNLVAPLSVLYLLVNYLTTFSLRIPHILEIWITLEALFYLFFYIPRRAYLQKIALHPAVCRNDRRKLFQRCFNNIPYPEEYLKKWFRDAPVAEIRRENVKEFMRWAFLNTGEPDESYNDELEEYVRKLEGLLKRKLVPGRGKAKCLRLTLDQVDMVHRSLLWYMVRLHCRMNGEETKFLTNTAGYIHC